MASAQSMDWFNTLVAVALMAGIYVSPMGLRMLQVKWLRRTCAHEGVLVLTFDDGPSPETTPRLLELLGRSDAKATFFMTGGQAEKHPELVEQVCASGHEIGSHSQDHLHAWRSSPRSLLRDLARGYESLERWARRTAPYRPPYGKLMVLSWIRLRSQRAPVGWWTIDSGDSKSPLPDVDAGARAVREAGGGVVLLHDLDRSADRNLFVLEATARILAVAEAEGLRVVPFGQIAECATSPGANPDQARVGGIRA